MITAFDYIAQSSAILKNAHSIVKKAVKTISSKSKLIFHNFRPVCSHDFMIQRRCQGKRIIIE